MFLPSDLVIDANATMGGKLPILTGIRERHMYTPDGKPTAEVIGYMYDCVAPGRGYKTISVRIDGDKQLDESAYDQPVKFSGLRFSMYRTDKRVMRVAARADSVTVTAHKG